METYFVMEGLDLYLKIKSQSLKASFNPDFLKTSVWNVHGYTRLNWNKGIILTHLTLIVLSTLTSRTSLFRNFGVLGCVFLQILIERSGSKL